MATTKKLIEVALPLDAINEASRREKSIRHGHPSTLHLWWARRPLAAARAVLFAQLVDDPSAHPDRFPTEEAQARERERLFEILQDLVVWENSNNEKVIARARAEILKSTGGTPPPVYDPFCGGGTIPLEGRRLGLEAHGSDLNPVAVLISKALVELPSQFRDRPPVHPNHGQLAFAKTWRGAAGLAEDIRYYGDWMRREAERRIGHLYPRVQLPSSMGGGEAMVIAWLWARTVASPNPALRGLHVPLVRSFALSTRKGHEAWVAPVIDRVHNTYSFEVKTGARIPDDAKTGTKTGRGASFRCLMSGDPIPDSHTKAEARAGRLGQKLLAIVCEGASGRVYLTPTPDQEELADCGAPDLPELDQDLADDPRNIWCVQYGLTTFNKLFTPRQLTALTTFSDFIAECREKVLDDATGVGLPDDTLSLHDRSTGAQAYANAIATYMALAVDRAADYWSSIASWIPQLEAIRNTFARQAIPMIWDFAEANPFSGSTGNWAGAVRWIAEAVEMAPVFGEGRVIQADATQYGVQQGLLVSTDPPYYDNISYADLADFFYVWLRRSLGGIYQDLFRTMLVPKVTELVATPYRFDRDKGRAKEHFEDGLHRAFVRLRAESDSSYPLTVYYAFKQADADDSDITQGRGAGTASTGWETMLEGLLRAGFTVVGTWPMRTERGNRPVANGTNALASSIVLVCRVRPDDAPTVSRREFLRILHDQLPPALRALQVGNIAPVDLAQASIGPGMAIFSRYRAVLEANGQPMRVRTALTLINEALDAVLTEQEGEYDPATRWALKWFQQFAYREAGYGDAEVLSKAQDVAVSRMEGRILTARAGKVRLLTNSELDGKWDPPRDVTIWEATHHLARILQDQGESGGAALLRRLSAVAGPARDLAYRLYNLCERQGWATDGLVYNGLVASWPEMQRLATSLEPGVQQSSLWDEEG